MPGEGFTSPSMASMEKTQNATEWCLSLRIPCGISRGSWGKAEFRGGLKRVREETSSRKTPECGWEGGTSQELAGMWKMFIPFLCVLWALSHLHNFLYPLWDELPFLSDAVRSAFQGHRLYLCCAALPGYLHSSLLSPTSTLPGCVLAFPKALDAVLWPVPACPCFAPQANKSGVVLAPQGPGMAQHIVAYRLEIVSVAWHSGSDSSYQAMNITVRISTITTTNDNNAICLKFAVPAE